MMTNRLRGQGLNRAPVTNPGNSAISSTISRLRSQRTGEGLSHLIQIAVPVLSILSIHIIILSVVKLLYSYAAVDCLRISLSSFYRLIPVTHMLIELSSIPSFPLRASRHREVREADSDLPSRTLTGDEQNQPIRRSRFFRVNSRINTNPSQTDLINTETAAQGGESVPNTNTNPSQTNLLNTETAAQAGVSVPKI